MALIKLGALAQDIRGKVNGNVFSRNAGGAYVRTKVSGTNPQTARQTQVREYFGFLSKDWSSGLTAGERAAWNSFALANPIVNVFGDSVQLSGIATYQRLNRTIQQVGGDVIHAPPGALNLTGLTGQAVTGTVTAGALTGLTMTVTPDPLQNNEELYIWATPPLAGGVESFKGKLRLINRPSDTIEPGDSAHEAYNARFGSPALVAGQRLGMLVATVNSATGAVSPGLQFVVTLA